MPVKRKRVRIRRPPKNREEKEFEELKNNEN